jgi:flagellar biosynthetic protein FliR
MNELLEQLAADPWGRLILQHLATGGMRGCFLFLLVMARLAGVFVVAPFGTTSLIPLPVRVGLVILLSLILLPTVSLVSAGDGNVIPIAHHASTAGRSFATDIVPDSANEFMSLIASEIGLGTMLGVGVLAVLSGLQLAGEWLDRHTGIGLGTVLNPNWSAGDSACGRLIPLLGVAVFLLLEPLGGQWLLFRSLAESFHAMPLGSAWWSVVTIELVNSLVQQSLVLGIRIALPLVVTMLAVEITLAFASRNAPVTVSSAALAMKAGVGLFVLAITLTAVPDVIETMISSLFP